MPNLSGVVRQLRKERDRAWGEMERLIAVLAGLGSLGILGREPSLPVILGDKFNGAEPVHLGRQTSLILHVTMM